MFESFFPTSLWNSLQARRRGDHALPEMETSDYGQVDYSEDWKLY